MTPIDNTQTIESVGNVNSIGRITVTSKNIPFLINAVTDRIYKDKAMAIIREYSTNASDAHIVNRLPINAVQITLPTLKDPTLRVRDIGTGLTMEQIRDVYCILGESTKRNSNDLNGMLGLGCKSAMGYGDSFIVTSWVNGVQSIYNIIKGDDHKEGDVLRMSEVPMVEGDRTGIEVAVPIKVSDLNTIHSKAADFFKYWVVLPTIVNMDETELTRMNRWRNTEAFLSGNGWEIRPNSSSYGYSARSVAVMGQVAYPIDWQMLRSKMALTPQKRIFTEILQSNEVVLQFPIGSLKFTINREELEYTDTTYANLESKIEEIFTTLEQAIITKFAGAKTIWEAKRIYLALFGKNVGDREDGESIDTNKALKILDGDFYRLESMFKGRLFWNNIEMNSPSFTRMNQWDVNYPTGFLEELSDPTTPCLVSYKRKKKQVKRLRCTGTEHNRITPFNGVKVIVIDGRNVSMMQTIARYYLLNESFNVHKLHLLRFSDDAQRQAFFDHYHFETAEYTMLSTVLDDIKAWQKANRKSYSRNGDGGGGGGTALLRYIDVTSGSIEESEVSLRDLEEGGVYASYFRKNIRIGGYNRELDRTTSALQDLAKYADMNLDRIYLIPEGKLEAKWFVKAKADGLWTEAGEYLKENGDVYVTPTMRKQATFQTFCANDDTTELLTYPWALAIANTLSESSPELNAYVEALGGEPTDFDDLQTAQRMFGLAESNFTLGTKPDYAALNEAVMAKFPLFKYMGICGDDADMDSKKLKALIEYVESLQAKRNLLTSQEVSV
jgi:hypothetical protein